MELQGLSKVLVVTVLMIILSSVAIGLGGIFQGGNNQSPDPLLGEATPAEAHDPPITRQVSIGGAPVDIDNAEDVAQAIQDMPEEPKIEAPIPEISPNVPAELIDPMVFGAGEVTLTFEVKIPIWTPSEDSIYLQIQDFHYGTNGGIPMEEREQGIWAVTFIAPSNELLEYKYNRNNFGFPTDEEFSPDSELSWREIQVGSRDLVVEDEVTKWRWLSETQNVKLVSFAPDSLPARESPFLIGMFMLDYFNPEFMKFIPSTFDKLRENGFEYVGIAYALGIITSIDPFEISQEPINTYSIQQLEYTIQEARKRGLKVVLSAGIETDPSDPERFEEIEAGLQMTHDDNWYLDLVREWEESMVRTATIAERHRVEIFTPSNQWPFWGDLTDDQKRLLNPLINDAYLSISQVYSGILSSDYYSDDELFDYYKQMDWIGDKWWFPLSADKNPKIEDMKVEAERIIDERYEQIFQKYRKPIFLQQLAYSSFDGSAGAVQISTEGPEVAEWFPYNVNYPEDFQEQADAYEAVFQAIFDETIFTGVFSFSYTYWDSHDKSAGVRAKPAEQVWMKWNSIFESTPMEIQNDAPVNEPLSRGEILSSLPDCTNQRLTVPPVDLELVYEITPLGNLNPPGHTLPTEHMYFHINAGGESTETYSLRAPGEVYIISVTGEEDLHQGEFSMIFALCKDVFGYYDHIKLLSEEVKSLLEPIQCEQYTVNPGNQCTRLLMHYVSASTILGEIGHLQGNFDFGAFDYRVQLSYANPWRYGNPDAEGFERSRSLSIICPIELYDDETKSRLYEKVARTVEPKCGKVMQDIGGTLQGNWFQGDIDPRSPVGWDGHLAFVHDNHDPSRLVISLGGLVTDSGKWEFVPLTSGNTNISFSDVSPDGTIYCYDVGQSGRILVQLLNPSELSIEYQSGTCSPDSEFSDPIIYRR